MDNLTRDQRTYCMSRIRSKDTKPELIVRRLSHMMGYRYRLYRSDLPGKPDLVFPKMKKVIFVHGCFWHSHVCPRGAVKPKTNVAYWNSKRERTLIRDKENLLKLQTSGWVSLVLWECQLIDIRNLERIIGEFLAGL